MSSIAAERVPLEANTDGISLTFAINTVSILIGLGVCCTFLISLRLRESSSDTNPLVDIFKGSPDTSS
jgi:hypothetical protein